MVEGWQFWLSSALKHPCTRLAYRAGRTNHGLALYEEKSHKSKHLLGNPGVGMIRPARLRRTSHPVMVVYWE